jgi:flavin-dependent dehydrogenase
MSQDTNNEMNHHYDAIVIGGGPAGSTCSALLARKGRRVLVLERDEFPRYHVGESLIPYCYFTLERLGVIDKLNEADYAVNKHSVQFVTEQGKISAPFYFFQHIEHAASKTWQVWRGPFDEMLLDHAREEGVEVHEGVNARELIRNESGQVIGVVAQDRNGTTREFFAPVTVDASGRDAFALRQLDWLTRDPELSKVTMWTYYKGAMRDKGYDEGATTVAYLPEKGWFWWIPLANDMVSVGITAERDYLYREGTKDPQTIFERELELNAWVKDHLSTGDRTDEFRVTSEYSYRSKHCAADGLVLIGDAFAFLDPVFSSGVFLALRSGELAADAIDEAISQNDVSANQFAAYGKEVCYGIESMRKLVYAFYEANFSFGSVIKKNPMLRGDLTDCLIGDVFRDFTKLFDAVSEFAAVPEPLAYGKPFDQTMVSQGDAM